MEKLELELKHFKCPVCKDYLQPPIFQCPTGHSICTDCKVNMGKCPTCLQGFSYTRNYVLESIMSTMVLECKNEQCTQLVPMDKYALHAQECPFGKVKCKHPKCIWSGNAGNTHENTLLMNEHIKMVHKAFVIQKNTKVESHQISVSFIEHNGNMFCIKRYVDDNFLMWSGEPTTAISTSKLFLLIKIVSASGNCYTLQQPISCYTSQTVSAQDNSTLCMLKSKTKLGEFYFSIEDDN